VETVDFPCKYLRQLQLKTTLPVDDRKLALLS